MVDLNAWDRWPRARRKEIIQYKSPGCSIKLLLAPDPVFYLSKSLHDVRKTASYLHRDFQCTRNVTQAELRQVACHSKVCICFNHQHHPKHDLITHHLLPKVSLKRGDAAALDLKVALPKLHCLLTSLSFQSGTVPPSPVPSANQ